MYENGMWVTEEKEKKITVGNTSQGRREEKKTWNGDFFAPLGGKENFFLL